MRNLAQIITVVQARLMNKTLLFAILVVVFSKPKVVMDLKQQRNESQFKYESFIYLSEGFRGDFATL